MTLPVSLGWIGIRARDIDTAINRTF